MAPPQLTDEQRRQALAKAGEARRIRAELKEMMRTGSVSLGEVFRRADADDIIAGTKVATLLPALPGIGKVKAMRLMEDCGIAGNRKVRGLGDRQRACLLAKLS